MKETRLPLLFSSIVDWPGIVCHQTNEKLVEIQAGYLFYIFGIQVRPNDCPSRYALMTALEYYFVV